MPLKTEQEVEGILGLRKSEGTIKLEIWHNTYDKVFKETGDLEEAAVKADQAICPHTKTKTEYSSDVFPDPPEIKGRNDAWSRCKSCRKILRQWNCEDERDYDQGYY